MCGVAAIVVTPAAAASAAIAIAPASSRAPSSIPGSTWEWRSITGSPRGAGAERAGGPSARACGAARRRPRARRPATPRRLSPAAGSRRASSANSARPASTAANTPRAASPRPSSVTPAIAAHRQREPMPRASACHSRFTGALQPGGQHEARDAAGELRGRRWRSPRPSRRSAGSAAIASVDVDHGGDQPDGEEEPAAAPCANSSASLVVISGMTSSGREQHEQHVARRRELVAVGERDQRRARSPPRRPRPAAS